MMINGGALHYKLLNQNVTLTHITEYLQTESTASVRARHSQSTRSWKRRKHFHITSR